MGKMQVNQREFVAPMEEMTVSDVKKMAQIPANEVLYDLKGQVLADNQVVSTNETQFGSVTDWVRG